MPELIEIEEKPHALENTYKVRKFKFGIDLLNRILLKLKVTNVMRILF